MIRTLTLSIILISSLWKMSKNKLYRASAFFSVLTFPFYLVTVFKLIGVSFNFEIQAHIQLFKLAGMNLSVTFSQRSMQRLISKS